MENNVENTKIVETSKEVPQKDTNSEPVVENVSIENTPRLFSKDDVKEIVSSAIDSALKNYSANLKLSDTMNYGKKLADSIATSQASLINPVPIIDERQEKIKHIEEILKDYEERKLRDSKGKALYFRESDDTLYRFKIIHMKKTGLTPEEIADIMFKG